MNDNLLKVLTFKDLFFIGLCDIIGSGIFYIFIYTLLYGKKQSILAVLTIGISSIISGLCYGEIISIFKNNSSEFNLVNSIFGENYSNIFSLTIIFFQLFTIATIIIALNKYLFKDNIIFGLFITCVIFLLLFYGIKLSTNIINVIGIIILIILIFIITIGLFNIKPVKNAFINQSTNTYNFLICCTFVVFLYSGYDSIIKVYDEVHPDHIKYIPYAIIGSIIIATILYLLLTIIMLYNFNSSSINAPISYLYKLFLGDYAYYITYIIGAIILFGTSFDISLISSRYIYGLAKNKILPDFLTTLSCFKTPYIILLLQFIFIFILVLNNNVEFALSMSNIFVFIVLIHINLGIVIYRYKNEKKENEFKMPFYYNNIPTLPLINLILLIILLFVSITLQLGHK